jgi:hypothetical protein
MPGLNIKLLQGWKPLPHSNGPLTFSRGDNPSAPVLQFSIRQHNPGPLPNVTGETLIAVCEKLGSKVKGGRVTSRLSGTCEFGLFGTVAFEGEEPAHFQAWVVSNQREFILATHVAAAKVLPEEAEEANRIVLTTSYE